MFNTPQWLRRYCRISTVTILLALFLSSADNQSFLHNAFQVIDKTQTLGIDFKIALFVCLNAIFTILLSISGFKPLFKPFAILIVITAAVVSYFMDTYSVIIDSAMIQNAVETDTKEVLELLNFGIFRHIALFGFLPAFLIYRCPIHYQPFLKELLSRGLIIGLAAIILSGTIFTYYKDFSITFRNNRELRFFINPTYPIYALFGYIQRAVTPPVVLTKIGEDAQQRYPDGIDGKKSLVVLVVGETARAQNFSLNGYTRNTNPKLSQLPVINFSNSYSCGTATAESVPCMFSHLNKDHYSDAKAKAHENLLDVLNRAGIEVLWRDNNSGCKGVCDRVKNEALENLKLVDLCNSEECFDEVLLHDLQNFIDRLEHNALIILHQKGSHGPAYYKRHPAAFTQFSPECTSGEVQDCTQEQITNAYDNTILYTDYFLMKVVEFLTKNSTKFNTAMWYMSDHGESLGENGIYLHGLPYFLAPDQQIHIPFILWLSPELSNSFKIDTDCLKQNSQNRYSHDNLFHSLLGLFYVNTTIYDPALDIFKKCNGIAQ